MLSPITYDTPLRVVLTQYIATNPRVRSEQSARRYRTTLNNFERWLDRPALLRDLTADNYGLFVKARQKERSAGTVRSDAEKLTVIWRWAALRAGGTIPPVVLPCPVDTEPVAWTLDELDRLERAARRAVGRIGGIPASLYWPAFIGVAIDTGERLAAIHALRPDDVNLKRRQVHFRRETRKGGRRSVTKDVTGGTAAHLRKLLAYSPGRLFDVVRPPTLYRPLNLLLARAGLPDDRVHKFHCLRKTHATHLHIQGGDATTSCDHRDPRTTVKHYIDRSQVPQQLIKRRWRLFSWG